MAARAARQSPAPRGLTVGLSATREARAPSRAPANSELAAAPGSGMVGFVGAPGVSAGCAAKGGAVGGSGALASDGLKLKRVFVRGVLATALGGLARVFAAVSSTPARSAMTR